MSNSLDDVCQKFDYLQFEFPDRVNRDRTLCTKLVMMEKVRTADVAEVHVEFDLETDSKVCN